MPSRTSNDQYRKIAKEILDDNKYRNIAAAVVGAGTDDEEDEEEEVLMEDEEDEEDSEMKDEEDAAAVPDAAAAVPMEDDEDEEEETTNYIVEDIEKREGEILEVYKEKARKKLEGEKNRWKKKSKEEKEAMILNRANELAAVDAASEIDSKFATVKGLVGEVNDIEGNVYTEEGENRLVQLKRRIWKAVVELFATKHFLKQSKDADIQATNDEIDDYDWNVINRTMEKLQNMIKVSKMHSNFTAVDQCRQFSGDEIFTEMWNRPKIAGYADEKALQKQIEQGEEKPEWMNGIDEYTTMEIAQAINQQFQREETFTDDLQRGFYSWSTEIPKDVWTNNGPKRIVLIASTRISKDLGLVADGKQVKNNDGHTIAIVLNQEEEGANAPCTITVVDPSHLLNYGIRNAEKAGYKGTSKDGPTIKYIPPSDDPSKPSDPDPPENSPMSLKEYLLERVLNQTVLAADAEARQENLRNLEHYLEKHQPELVDAKYARTLNMDGDCALLSLAAGWYLLANEKQQGAQNFHNIWKKPYGRPWEEQPLEASEEGKTILENVAPLVKVFQGIRHRLLQNPNASSKLQKQARVTTAALSAPQPIPPLIDVNIAGTLKDVDIPRRLTRAVKPKQPSSSEDDVVRQIAEAATAEAEKLLEEKNKKKKKNKKPTAQKRSREEEEAEKKNKRKNGKPSPKRQHKQEQ